jgi:ABC-type branched-subunit amino acid transport system ATPase component
MPENEIMTKALTKNFGYLTAFDNLNLDVKGGELLGLLGPNVAGETIISKARFIATISPSRNSEDG